MKKHTGLNKKLLGRMTAGKITQTPLPANPSSRNRKPVATLHLRGVHAKALHHLQPGSRIKAHVRGTVKNLGFDRYGSTPNEPTAEVDLHNMDLADEEKGG